MIRARVAGHDLAGVDAGSVLETDSVVAHELLVQFAELVAHLGGGADRAQRVVLVHEWEPEDSHDRVADELLDSRAVALERSRHYFEVASHDAPERLGIKPFPERRRAGDVREQNGDGLANFGTLRLALGERGATGRAEARIVRVLSAARRADPHAEIVRASRSGF